MFAFQRRRFVKGFVHVVMAVTLLGFAAVQSACESTPMRAIRGARHYAVGTEALSRSDGVLAIAELERAAELVPRASEIQNQLGLAYWSDGREQAAKLAFEKAIEFDCDNVIARMNLDRLRRSAQAVVETTGEEASGVARHGG
jgi:Flp pilus assembly protein TadD